MLRRKTTKVFRNQVIGLNALQGGSKRIANAVALQTRLSKMTSEAAQARYCGKSCRQNNAMQLKAAGIERLLRQLGNRLFNLNGIHCFYSLGKVSLEVCLHLSATCIEGTFSAF